MHDSSALPSPQRLARVAGLLYLVIIVCGVGGQGLIREPMIGETAAQTVAAIQQAALAFRLSVLADVAMVLADVGLGALLYVLLAPVSRTLSLAAMAFRLAQASVLGVNLVHLLQAQALAGAPGLEGRDALVMSLLDAHAVGYDLGLMFFAVNCLLVGVLIARSKFLPRALGVGVGVSGVVYLVGGGLRVLAPALAAAFAPAYVVPLLAELALCGWLLARGLDAAQWRRDEMSLGA
ncbi:MAG: DUF4386 domain-containing protein [Myxococcales bacterium]|nr:DUF4386 domain-containing protein [Myxococcales bacterium]